MSALTNKFGCRVVCMAGALVASAGFALSALSPSLDVLLITYGVIGGKTRVIRIKSQRSKLGPISCQSRLKMSQKIFIG